MIFNPRPLDLGIASIGEDVVAEGVLLAVMLVKATVRGAIDEVVLRQNMRRSLVEVDAPSAILQARDVVEAVEADDRTFLVAQGINTAHIAEYWRLAVGSHADVMDVIVLDDVPRGRRLCIAPSPTDGYARIPESMNVVMGNRIVVRLADPNGHTTRKQVAAVA